jgi:hypothetical protein
MFRSWLSFRSWFVFIIAFVSIADHGFRFDFVSKAMIDPVATAFCTLGIVVVIQSWLSFRFRFDHCFRYDHGESIETIMAFVSNHGFRFDSFRSSLSFRSWLSFRFRFDHGFRIVAVLAVAAAVKSCAAVRYELCAASSSSPWSRSKRFFFGRFFCWDGTE